MKGNLHIDAALTNVAMAYKNTNLIASSLMPTIDVAKQSGKVYKFGKDAFRLSADVRAPGTVSNRIQAFSVSTDTYFCDNHALHDVIPTEDIENADVAVQPEISATEGLVDMVLLGREKALADYLFNTASFSGYTSALSGGDKWDDYTSSDPIANAETAIDAIRQQTGAKANTVVLGSSVYIKLRRHPQLLDMFKYTAGAILTEQQVAEALGVKKLYVGSAVYNSAQEGATVSMADIWGKYCMFAYIAEKPELRKPSLGYSYRWKTGINGYQVYKTVKDGAGEVHGTIIEVMNYFDDIIHGADLGYLFSTVVG